MVSNWAKLRRALKVQSKFNDTLKDPPLVQNLLSLDLGQYKLVLDPETRKWRPATDSEHIDPKKEPAFEKIQDNRPNSPTKNRSNSPTLNSTINSNQVNNLQQRIRDLEEENNMLKYRQEVLLDMLAKSELDKKNYDILLNKLRANPELTKVK